MIVLEFEHKTKYFTKCLFFFEHNYVEHGHVYYAYTIKCIS